MLHACNVLISLLKLFKKKVFKEEHTFLIHFFVFTVSDIYTSDFFLLGYFILLLEKHDYLIIRKPITFNISICCAYRPLFQMLSLHRYG